MPDLLRRGAVHLIVVALIIGALAPQTVASTRPDPATDRLLAAVAPSAAALISARGPASQRGQASATSLSVAAPAPVEAFHPDGVAHPPSVTMEATLIGVPIQWVDHPGGPATVTGTASWYCCTMNWGDAAVAALPIALGGHYYPPPGGFMVTVCADRCARIPVGDACGCHWGRVGQKVIDLSPAAWAAITDRDRYVYGIVTVTVYLD